MYLVHNTETLSDFYRDYLAHFWSYIVLISSAVSSASLVLPQFLHFSRKLRDMK